MKACLFIAFLILLVASSDLAQQAPQTASGDSSSVRASPAQGDPESSSENESPIGGGLRCGIAIHTADNTYLNNQLSHFDVDGFTAGWGVLLAAYVTSWDYYLEFEVEAAGFPEEDMFEGKTHTVLVKSIDLGVCARRGFNDILRKTWENGPRIDLLPGISALYVSDANVRMREKGRGDWTQILEGNGWGYAVGAVLRWQLVFFEYRYRWVRLNDVKPDSGGEFFFPRDPELDFSGHFCGLGIDLGTHLKLRSSR